MIDPKYNNQPIRKSWARYIFDPLFLPLLILLHLIFTFSSLILRIYELLTTPEPSTTSTSALGSGSARSASPTGSDVAVKRWVPPKHVAMVLLPPSPAQRAQWTGSSKSVKAREKRARARREVVDRAVESVLNLVEMAGEEGVVEVSVYEATGILELAKSEILAELVHEATIGSPPASPSPADTTPSRPGVPNMLQQTNGHASKSPDATLTSDDGVTTLTVFQTARFSSASAPSPITPLVVHILPPSASEIIPAITRDFIKSGMAAEKVTQELISRKVHEAFHFTRDPDLLIVHALQSLSGWRSWLPRPAPELGGYPFWTLRVTEIYHHPPQLPFITTLAPLLHLAQSSSLPFFRKIGRLVPTAHANASAAVGAAGAKSELVDLYRGAGRLGMDEWDGAMRAWSVVEQRSGR